MCATIGSGSCTSSGVEIVPYARLYGVDGSSVYFQHATSGEPSSSRRSTPWSPRSATIASPSWKTSSPSWSGEVHVIGDAQTPRTAEEAVLEGLKVAAAL